jgi:hypothetical protein
LLSEIYDVALQALASDKSKNAWHRHRTSLSPRQYPLRGRYAVSQTVEPQRHWGSGFHLQKM